MLLFTALIMYGSAIKAQTFYNKTYYDALPASSFPGSSYDTNRLVVVDHVSAQANGSSVMLAKCAEIGKIGTKLILTKFDYEGNILFQRLWETDLSDAQIRPDKLILTGDNGFIVVGSVYRTATATVNPFAVKFTKTGDHTATEWSYEYTCNSGAWGEGRIPKVNIVKVEGSSDDYIIVANGKPEDPGVVAAYPQDAVITALRINGSDGSVTWANKYGMPLGMRTAAVAPFGYHSLPGSSPNLDMIINMPHALANGNGKSIIAGSVDWGIQYGLGYLGFYMAINDDGTINQDYNFMNTWAPTEHNAIFDKYATGTPNPKFILSYNSANPSTLPGYTGASIQKFSAAGVATPDMVGGLPVADYYTEGGDELYTMGITERYNKLHYVLSFWSRMSEGGMIGTPAMMMVDKNEPSPSMAPLINYYNKFNINNPTTANGVSTMLALTDYGSLRERYVLFNKLKKAGRNCIRMISADDQLEACGFRNEPMLTQRVNSAFSPLPHLQQLISPLKVDLSFTEHDIANESDYCDWAPYSGDYYRMAQPIAADSINVYPTLLKDDQQAIILDVQVTNAATLETTIVGMNGAVVQHQQFQLNAGSQQFRLSQPTLAPGQYLVNVATADGKINKHVLITKI